MNHKHFTLITCHANSDFDAFSAMLAARRLYDNSFLLFPGTQEEELKKVFAAVDRHFFNFIEPNQISEEHIGRVVIVDTKQRSRLSHVAKYMNHPDMEIIVWDHHPETSDDIKTCHCYQKKIGAVTSLLVQHLADNDISLSPHEATLLGIGIYSDTGAFTYTSTTEEDFLAAAWLLRKDMDVNLISEMLEHRMTSIHVHILNQMIEAAKAYQIAGINIVITEVSLEHYLGDFANLVHQLMEMEKFTVLFAIGFMGDRVQLVARSRNEDVNVGAICKAFNGGGHTYAASASIHSRSASEIRETILYAIHRKLHKGKNARDYMSSPVIGIETSTTMQKADELMLHFSLKSVPVFREGTRQCAGLLDSETASKATAHGLGNARAEDYIQRNFKSLSPDASLNDLATIIMDFKQRIVPIEDGKNVCGVVTRTDLMRIFAEDFTPGKTKKISQDRIITKLIQDRLPREITDLLHLIQITGERLGLPVYAVGGFVRDLFLEVPNHDIDLVVEGNGIALAKALASELCGRINEHKKFLTSVVIFKNAQGIEKRIDVATARLEYYEEPAALPNVEQSSIKMDISRRDFTINALAIRLDGKHFGQLKDFFDGQRDIKNKLVRVLHTLSFVEDPTRCLRAIRFEQRYQFSLGVNTEKLIRNAVALGLLDKLSSQRIFNEYHHICQENNAHACFVRLFELDVLSGLLPTIAMTPKNRVLLAKTTELLHWFELVADERVERVLVYFLALTNSLKYVDAEQAYSRLGLPQKTKREILSQREQTRYALKAMSKDGENIKTSVLCDLLRPFSNEALLYLMALSDVANTKKIVSYITLWRKQRIEIDGYTLRKLGLEAGPAYRDILKTVLNAKLDGLALDAKQQFQLASQCVAMKKKLKNN